MCLVHHIVQLGNLVAVHRRLESVDRIDFRNDDTGSLSAERVGAAFADITVAAHHGGLAAEQDICGAHDPVRQGMPHSVLIVEFRLGDRIIDVDRGE